MMKFAAYASTLAIALALPLAHAGAAQLSSASGKAQAVTLKPTVGHMSVVTKAKSKTYSYDDGSSEDAIAFGDGSTNVPAIWFDHFTTVKGGESISAVEIAYGTPANTTKAKLLNGTPVTVAIWSDPNGDGDPTDAVLIAKVKGTIQSANKDTFVTYTFKTPVAIGPKGTSFFAGEVTPAESSAEYYFQGIDETTTAVMSYVAAQANGGKLNIKKLGKNDTVGTIDSFGLPGNWLIRATGVAAK